MARRVSLRGVCRQVLARVSGARLVEDALRARPLSGSWRVWAVGKAAQAMAVGAVRVLGAQAIDPLVIAKRGAHGPRTRGTLMFADHPVPSRAGVAAADELLARAARLDDDDQVLLLLSGGASALTGAPIAGVTLAEWQKTTQALLRGGASIHEINTLRRRLGRVSGGKLAAATLASISVLALSDVRGDDPATIGSGPVTPDPATVAEALAIATRFRAPPSVIRALERQRDHEKRIRTGVGAAREHAADRRAAASQEAPLATGDDASVRGATTPREAESLTRPCAGHRGAPAGGDARVRYRVLANPETLRDAATEVLRARGASVAVRNELVDGSVEAFAAELVERGRSLAPGEVYLAVGEPTVVVRGRGRGGRGQHLALLVARQIAGQPLCCVALGSDGTDGPTPAAGAIVDGDTWPVDARGRRAAERAIARSDSHTWLSARKRLLMTGYTGTNLTDLFLVARSDMFSAT
jgi:glycerate-2-kinase